MSYLDQVQRARQAEALELGDQDRLLVTIMRLHPARRARLMTRMIQFEPELVAEALDDLEYHDQMAGRLEVDVFYQRVQERYVTYRAASTGPPLGHPADCVCDDCDLRDYGTVVDQFAQAYARANSPGYPSSGAEPELDGVGGRVVDELDDEPELADVDGEVSR